MTPVVFSSSLKRLRIRSADVSAARTAGLQPSSQSNMATLNPCFYVLPLLVHACFGEWGGERRFSDLKRCADEECSMLLGRGKAAKDFTGPDCRFLSFKKGETIYMYYKLSGQRSDMWAGSVGNHFGYFPKDYLTVNHIYTEKEFEVPSEETDFVCFDTGLDKFDSYDIDVLLGNSLLIENENLTEDSKEPSHEAELSQLPSETETESSGSPVHLKTEPLDSESHLGTDSLSETKSLDSELPKESESLDLESRLETKSLDSELPKESESLDLESRSETMSIDSELPLESDSSESESLSEITLFDSELPKESEFLDLESLSETMSLDSELPIETDSSDSESRSETTLLDSEIPKESESIDSESHLETESESLSETKSLDSKSLSETKSLDSELSKESDSLDSESLSEKETVEPLESPERDADGLISIDEEPYSFRPKIEDISSETTLESEDEPEKQDPEMNAAQLPEIPYKQAKISPSKDVDVKMNPSDSDVYDIDHSEQNHQSHSERRTDSEDVTESPVEPQASDSEIEIKEPTKTEEEKPLLTAEKTLEMVEEIAENVWSTFKEAEVKDETQRSPEEITKDEDMETVQEESHVKDLGGPENMWTESEKQADADDEDQIPTFSQQPDTTGDPNNTETKSHDIPLEAPVESHTENMFPSVLTDDVADKEDPQTLDTNQTETTNENTEDLQMVNMNTNENANKNTKDDDPQNAAPNQKKIADDKIEEADPEKFIINQRSEALYSSETEALLDESDDQVRKVKHNIVDLLKSTLESEQRRAEDEKDDAEELLEDENALFASSKSQFTEDTREPEIHSDSSDDVTEADEVKHTNATQDEDASQHKHESEEPVYSDGVLRLTILRDHLKDEDMERIQKHLGLKNLFKLEAMFSDLDQEMLSVRTSQTGTEDAENTLDQIMEASENAILDETEEILNEKERSAAEHGKQKEPEMYDLEATILDSFQEIVFSLRQKHSAAKDSAPLLEEEQTGTEEQHDSSVAKDDVHVDGDAEKVEPPEIPDLREEQNESEVIVNSELNANAQDLSPSQDMGLEEDGGHFNRNKDAQMGFEDTEEIQKGLHGILENPLDIGLHFEMDPSSGSLETPSVSDIHDTETNTDISSSSASDERWSTLLLVKECLGVYAEVIIADLPEEWRPGPTFHGVPWEPVLVTAAVGFLTVLMFFWRTVLAIKGRTYALTEKQLEKKIQQLLSEKSESLNKISELNAGMKEREEQLKSTEKTLGSSKQDMKQLKMHHKKLQSQCEEMSGSISQLNQKIVDTQEENSSLNEKIIKMHQRIEKYQITLKNFDDERAKVHVLMDEAKFREDALKAQVNCFEKENNALKERKKSLLRDAKDWQEKHAKLSEDIRVYHKSQKELEDSLVHKENEIDVLSGCIAELTRLGACDVVDSQKDDAKMSHREEADKKMDTTRLRIKQMMDVSRIKATLSVVEDERNRYMENLLTEQKSRQELEEQYQKVMHDQMNLKSDKTHLENQFKNLQQRLEITTELYQQKENALQQKLTQEELERREKETKLTEVDSKALRSDEELRALKQKIRDVEEEMQQNEQTLRNEVAIQEKKAHENWLKARASERVLVEERREAVTLRQKLVECSDKISDLEQTVFRINSAPPDRHMPPMRRGDSYGPSPVSGGAPSPPLMIEGPGRPPSAPVGRRSDSFGTRPPSDPHGRFSELGHPLPSRPEMFPPMTSSPCAHDGPMTAAVTEKAEQVSSEPVESLSKSQSQGSFLPSPIRDSPVPPMNAPFKSYGPPMMGGPILPNGPPSHMIRPPNGHPPMMPPGLGPEPRFRPPPMDPYRPPPPIGPYGPVPPPFARGPPLRDLPPMGPLPPLPLDPRDFHPDFYGPRGLPPRPFHPGSLPPPGAMAPHPYGGRGFPGPAPLVAQSSRDEENVTTANSPPTDGPSQDAGGSSVAEP
ncbi:transport and Golgi organization protein 1 homolog isoform X2 [Triplophysa dalaica]|uniref:transport and Golgi organization protein 1 homolog isoform X2 n=1 Tax=Triplophysa dalaica TaxID=1582913 RepID=UPI0024DFED24|nr:transport and Golgi organization protein 1 homolog isoform X2 [Triplophysa dalaica]